MKAKINSEATTVIVAIMAGFFLAVMWIVSIS